MRVDERGPVLFLCGCNHGRRGVECAKEVEGGDDEEMQGQEAAVGGLVW